MPHLSERRPHYSIGPAKRRVILLSSYGTGATGGKNLAGRGYSYDFVARAFMPLLSRWGEVIEVGNCAGRLEIESKLARRRRLHPLHISLRAFPDVHLARSAPNILVPALEFPDLPGGEFDNEPQGNWVRTANRSTGLLVGGPFTKNALVRAGVETPIKIVQVPIPDACFRTPEWKPGRRRVLDLPGYVLPAPRAAVPGGERVQKPKHHSRRPAPRCAELGDSLWGSYKRFVRPCLPARLEETLTAAARAAVATWRVPYPKIPKSGQIDLSGVVYTSIFAPADARKNWKDLLTGFLLALGNRDDATLVLKLITEDPSARSAVLAHYRRLDIRHRCKLVVITDFLTEEQMQALMEASTYYITTTRAEGNCLPLMHYLAAGRPGISPCHTAIADYFGSEMGCVVDSHPEPTAWPHDGRFRCRTTWHRLVWPSLVEQIRSSYRIATCDRRGYERLSRNARQKMQQWAGAQRVSPRLLRALDATAAAHSAGVLAVES